MGDWTSLIEEQLKKAIDEGCFSNLPGEGKPLKVDFDPNVPDHLRVAFKLLKDGGYAPDWITQGAEIDARRANLIDNIKGGARAYKGALQDAQRDAINGEQRQMKAHQAWELARKAFIEAAAVLNREILGYNLKVPQGVTHKLTFEVEREIQR